MEREQEIEEKIERLSRLLKGEGLGGVLLNAQHNFAWATAGGANGIDLSVEAGAGAVFIRADNRRFVLANKIEMPRLLSEELAGLGFEPIEFAWEEEQGNPALYVAQAHALAGGAQIGTDLYTGNLARMIEPQLARLRYRLTDAEIKRFRALGRDAGEAVGEVARTLEPGLTELEVARRTTDALAARNIHTVVALVAADERLARFRHPVPTEMRWKHRLMIVVCARRNGLVASLTRIVCVGAIPDELRRRTEACARVNALLFHATRPGTSGRELYDVAARAYESVGFPGEIHAHHQGGAAGYRTRDWVAHPACEERVENRQAFAWNPSITGTKTEETCIINGNEIEVVTMSPGWERIAVPIAEREYVLPGVLRL